MNEQTAQATQRRVIQGTNATMIRLEGLVGELPRKGDIMINPSLKTKELVVDTRGRESERDNWHQMLTLARSPDRVYLGLIVPITEAVYDFEIESAGQVYVIPAGATSLEPTHPNYAQCDRQLKEAGL